MSWGVLGFDCVCWVCLCCWLGLFCRRVSVEAEKGEEYCVINEMINVDNELILPLKFILKVLKVRSVEDVRLLRVLLFALNSTARLNYQHHLVNLESISCPLR